MRARDASSRPTRSAFEMAGRRGQHVVVLPLDLVQHAHAAAAEQVDIERQPPVHHARQRQAFEEQLARLPDDLAHDLAESRA